MSVSYAVSDARSTSAYVAGDLLVKLKGGREDDKMNKLNGLTLLYISCIAESVSSQ